MSIWCQVSLPRSRFCVIRQFEPDIAVTVMKVSYYNVMVINYET